MIMKNMTSVTKSTSCSSTLVAKSAEMNSSPTSIPAMIGGGLVDEKAAIPEPHSIHVAFPTRPTPTSFSQPAIGLPTVEGHYHSNNFYGTYSQQQTTTAINGNGTTTTTTSNGGGLIPTKLYVTNFPFTCTQRQIQDLFTQFGQVVECTLKKDYYAYILYTSCKSAYNAYKTANGYKMFGRKLTVHLATSKKSQSHLTTSPVVPPAAFFSSTSSSPTAEVDQIPKIVHVRNFPETCSQQQIRDVFAQYGDIVECLILHDSYAFVHFKSPLDARLALQSTNNKPFFGSTAPLLVQYSRSKFKQVQPPPSHTPTATNPIYGQNPQMPISDVAAFPGSRRPSNFRKPMNNTDQAGAESNLNTSSGCNEDAQMCEPGSFGDELEYNDFRHVNPHQISMAGLNGNGKDDDYEDEFTDELVESLPNHHHPHRLNMPNSGLIYPNSSSSSSQRQNFPINQQFHQQEYHLQGSNPSAAYYPNQFNGNGGNRYVEPAKTNYSNSVGSNSISYSPVMGTGGLMEGAYQSSTGYTNGGQMQSQQPIQQQLTRTKLYVTNFPEEMDQEEMKQLFNQYGQVLECTIMWNQYAFVHFGSVLEAEKAMNGIKGTQYKGFKLSVQWSTSSKYQQPKQHQSRLYNHQQQQCMPPLSSVNDQQPIGSSTGGRPVPGMSVPPKILERPTSHHQIKKQEDPSPLIVHHSDEMIDKAQPVHQQLSHQFNMSNLACDTSSPTTSSSSSSSIQANSIETPTIKSQNTWPHQAQQQATWASLVNEPGEVSHKPQSRVSPNITTGDKNSASSKPVGPFKVSFSEIVRSSASSTANLAPAIVPPPVPQPAAKTSLPLTPKNNFPAKTNGISAKPNLDENRKDAGKINQVRKSETKNDLVEPIQSGKSDSEGLDVPVPTDQSADPNMFVPVTEQVMYQGTTPPNGTDVSKVNMARRSQFPTPFLNDQVPSSSSSSSSSSTSSSTSSSVNAYKFNYPPTGLNVFVNGGKPGDLIPGAYPGQFQDTNQPIFMQQQLGLAAAAAAAAAAVADMTTVDPNLIQYHQQLQQQLNTSYQNSLLYKQAIAMAQRQVVWQPNPAENNNQHPPLYNLPPQSDAFNNTGNQNGGDYSTSNPNDLLSNAFGNLSVGDPAEPKNSPPVPLPPNSTTTASTAFNSYVLFPSDSFDLSVNDNQADHLKSTGNEMFGPSQPPNQQSSIYYHIEDVLANLIR